MMRSIIVWVDGKKQKYKSLSAVRTEFGYGLDKVRSLCNTGKIDVPKKGKYFEKTIKMKFGIYYERLKQEPVPHCPECGKMVIVNADVEIFDPFWWCDCNRIWNND